VDVYDHAGSLLASRALPIRSYSDISPDGSRVVAGGKKATRLLDTQTGEVVGTVGSGGDTFFGDWYIEKPYTTVTVWDSRNGALVARLASPLPKTEEELAARLETPLPAAKLGSLLFAVQSVEEPEAPMAVGYPALSSDGRFLQVGGDSGAGIWDLRLQQFQETSPANLEVSFIPMEVPRRSWEDLSAGVVVEQGDLRIHTDSGWLVADGKEFGRFSSALVVGDVVVGEPQALASKSGPGYIVWSRSTGRTLLNLWWYSDGGFLAWWADGTVQCRSVGCDARWAYSDGTVAPLRVPKR
jgi:hypothetical protein